MASISLTMVKHQANLQIRRQSVLDPPYKPDELIKLMHEAQMGGRE